jgi:hypothetical protein
MSSDQRVVIKSSWKSLAASAGYTWLLLFVLVGTLAVVGAVRSLALYVVLIVVFPFLVTVLRATQYLELTPRGLEIHGFSSTTTLEWPFVGSVDCVTKGSGGYLTVEDLFANRSRTLPAPRAVGEAGVAEAGRVRELIEQWRLAQCGPDPVPAAHPAPVPPVVDLDLA